MRLFLLLLPACALVPSRPYARRALRRCAEEEPTVIVLGSEPPAEAGAAVAEEAEEAAPVKELTEKQKEIARLRAAEKFVEKETGSHVCRVCDFTYDPAEGAKGVAAGTQFAEIPSNWRCPRCRASKDSFDATTITIAGFAENQGYGFGGNEMTEGDKNLAIFGGLGFFFVLFLSGYLMT
mmetsp:Transcript_20515/g.61172  ORF Transcript_20515/g.61172 Transcript_20515/m.61172 type:complete len:180 (-) Transcript_20515:37-576(-)|eukprot:CAMPEP_0119268618 /NCGR_PEP_ID=MMETSP1329-20130426/6341_1 /TAXON_ID=114041 /ORGANISM="Genus nov. species nov., Strain RCC1024" /LENGTH=179 /DNA_ID=CAMNT_0007268597 /DNA_START=184 /DNA_END=723 /DNA_ORIENTATION=+